jgi:hypothetical protein
VRLKRDGDGLRILLARPLHNVLEHVLVGAVHAVEVAHADHG